MSECGVEFGGVRVASTWHVVDGRISEIGFGFGHIVSGRKGLKMWKVKKEEKRKPEMKKKSKK